jgi:hypothetical protein
MPLPHKGCARRFRLWLFAFGIALHSLHGAENKAAVAAAASNASSNLQVPILGFVAQQPQLSHHPIARSAASQARGPQQVRQVVGIPGSAALGDLLALPADLTSVEISPSQTCLIAERGVNQAPAMLSLGPSGAGAELIIAGAFPRSDRIEFSISGATAALYSGSLQSVQVITGLPGSPQVSQQFDVSALPAPLTALAVSDDGTSLLAGVSDGDTGGIYLITAGNGVRRVVSAKLPAAIQFLSQSDSALIADSRADQVLLLSGVTGTVSSTLLATSADGAKGPSQIQMIGGTQAALVANTASDALFWIDLPTRKLTPVSFSYQVLALQAVSGSPVVLISTARSALWLVNQTPGGPLVTFVPGSSGSTALAQ